MKKYKTTRISTELYDYLKHRKVNNNSSIREESQTLFKEFTEIHKKIGKGRVFLIK